MMTMKNFFNRVTKKVTAAVLVVATVATTLCPATAFADTGRADVFQIEGIQDVGIQDGENQDGAIAEALLIAALTYAAKLIFSTVTPDTFEEFYKIIKDNPVKVQLGLTAVTGPVGMVTYNLLSSSTQKKLWSKVYASLKF